MINQLPDHTDCSNHIVNKSERVKLDSPSKHAPKRLGTITGEFRIITDSDGNDQLKVDYRCSKSFSDSHRALYDLPDQKKRELINLLEESMS